jgi:competence protein ComEC
MAEIIRVLYAGRPETKVYDKPVGKKRLVNVVLHGTWLGVVEERADGWVKVRTAGPDGWVRESDTRADLGLKMFFIDVGQGDSCLVEVPGKRLLVDGGPKWNTRGYLRNWQYSYLLKEKKQIRLDCVIVSHFDDDHFAGLIPIIKDKNFEIGAIYHNGIARFARRRTDRPAEYDTDLGQTDAHGQQGAKRTYLKTTFSSVEDAKKLLRKGGLRSRFKKFLEAVVEAKDKGRLGSMRRLTVHSGHVPGFSSQAGLRVDVLGPVPLSPTGPVYYPWFTDSSHTINGHSLVLRFAYGERSILLGGDLNSESEDHLLRYYQGQGNPFWVDVAKSCHHGSADFTVAFMEAISPFATVISSGDNESYSHPRADALGAAGRYSRGARPMVYGMINLRSDGGLVIMAQMKERRTGADIWDSYLLP